MTSSSTSAAPFLNIHRPVANEDRNCKVGAVMEDDEAETKTYKKVIPKVAIEVSISIKDKSLHRGGGEEKTI